MYCKYFLAFVILSLFYFLPSFAQPVIQWENSFGLVDDDKARSIIQTSDGGYILAGESHEYWGGSLSSHDSLNHGNWDWLVIRLDYQGNIQWQKFYGGSYEEYYPTIIQTDGGYLIAGYSASNDGDVDTNFVGVGAWVIKIDTLGIILWQRKISDFNNIIPSIKKVMPQGYILAGSSFNYDSLSPNFGSLDYMIIKIDSNGIIEWEKTYGGSDRELVNEIIQTSDSGYAVIGSSESINGNVTGNHGSYDYWIIKLDQTGNLLWEKSLGGQYSDIGLSIIENNNKELVAGGYTESNNGDVTGNHGNQDTWLAGLDSIGNIIWQKCFGGSGEEYGVSMSVIDSDKILLAVPALSNDGDLSFNHGDYDYWLLEINSGGNILWQQSYGGSMIDWPTSIQRTTDGGCITAGYSESTDGDVTGHHGLFQNKDYWILKLSSLNVDIDERKIPRKDISLFSNPVTDYFTINLPEQTSETEVTIINAFGQEVSKTRYYNSSIINTEIKGASGLYFIKIVTRKNTWFKKIVVSVIN